MGRNLSLLLIVVITCLLFIQNIDCKKKKKKTWTFAFSLDGFPANFINETTGDLSGQSVDMVLKICELANKKCKVLSVPRQDCWDDVTMRSKVLDKRKYDVCANLVESPDRNIFYRFADQNIYRIPHPVLVRRPGDNTVNNDTLKQCNDLVLAYPALTALNRDCLLTAGMFVKEDNVLPIPAVESIVDAIDEIVKAVLDGRADVGLVIPRLLFGPSREQIEIFGESPCLSMLIGLNMMINKNTANSDDFLSWWDPTLKNFICGIRKIKRSGLELGYVNTKKHRASKEPKRQKRRIKNKIKNKIKKIKKDSYEAFCQLMRDKYAGVDPLCFTPGVDVDCPGNPIPPPPTDGGPIDPCANT